MVFSIHRFSFSKLIYSAAIICLLLSSTSAGNRITNTSALIPAAEHNVRLKNELRWTFGGKQQRGWWLYVPLICHLLNTASEPDSGEFALALSRWQKGVGILPTGVLEHETWMKIVSVFQARRFNGRSTPRAELQLIPASECFDSERPEDLRYADRQAFAAYRRMVAAAAADLSIPASSSEKWLKIVSAFRSPVYQAQLRRRSRGVGRAGLAINSPHFTGRALDLYMGGEPVSTKDHNRAIQVKTLVYQWMVRNAERFNFYPYFYEPWHWEYHPQPLPKR